MATVKWKGDYCGNRAGDTTSGVPDDVAQMWVDAGLVTIVGDAPTKSRARVPAED